MQVAAGMTGSLAAVWLVIMVVLLIVEAAVPGLISIWFALGALAALLAALLRAPLWLQVLWFLVVSITALILTRPLAKKYINSRVKPTNADMILGKDCVVTEEIDNVLGTGAVTAGGKVWTARMADDSCKGRMGQVMKVLRIEGVKLIVEAKKD